MPAHQGSPTRRHPSHPHCLPADNKSFSSNLGGCTKTSWHWIKHNTLQRNRTARRCLSVCGGSPSPAESAVASWTCLPESIAFICPHTLEIITGSPLIVFVYSFLLIKRYGTIQQRLFNCSSWKIDAALKNFFASRRYWENTGVKATWEHMFYSHARMEGRQRAEKNGKGLN